MAARRPSSERWRRANTDITADPPLTSFSIWHSQSRRRESLGQVVCNMTAFTIIGVSLVKGWIVAVYIFSTFNHILSYIVYYVS